MSVSSFKSLASSFVNDTFADFTKPFAFESLTETSDGQGGYTTTWITFASVTGFVKVTSGKELILDEHINSEYLRKFSFEYVAGLENNMRILYEGDYYNIHKIQSVQDSTIWIDVIASKSVAT